MCTGAMGRWPSYNHALVYHSTAEAILALVPLDSRFQTDHHYVWNPRAKIPLSNNRKMLVAITKQFFFFFFFFFFFAGHLSFGCH